MKIVSVKEGKPIAQYFEFTENIYNDRKEYGELLIEFDTPLVYDEEGVLLTPFDFTEEQLIAMDRMVWIKYIRFPEIDIKRFKFVDGELTPEEYEPYKTEVVTLRAEYNELESQVNING